jgi:D-amino-acid dehydrogenase
MMNHRPLVVWPLLDTRLYGGWRRLLANARRPLQRQQVPHGAPGRVFARRAARLRDATGIQYDSAPRALSRLFRTQKQLDAVGAAHCVTAHKARAA